MKRRATATVTKHEVCSENMYTQHIFRIIMSNYDCELIITLVNKILAHERFIVFLT